MKKVLVINGPNLNMLGRREENHYGVLTLEGIYGLMKKEYLFDYTFFTSNHEGEIIDQIHKSLDFDAIIINAGAYTHTSVAIMDALRLFKNPIVEVHLSNIYQREEYRKVNYIKEVSTTSFIGEKELSYIKAVRYLKEFFNLG